MAGLLYYKEIMHYIIPRSHYHSKASEQYSQQLESIYSEWKKCILQNIEPFKDNYTAVSMNKLESRSDHISIVRSCEIDSFPLKTFVRLS